MNPVMVYDRETAEQLREATPHEVDMHFQDVTRDEPALFGEGLGFPGRKLWLARRDPSLTILGWTPDGHPIFRGWRYRGEVIRGVRRRSCSFSDAEALAFSRDALNDLGRAHGDHYRAPGALVSIDYRQDLGLPPEPILIAWKNLYVGKGEH